MLKLLPLFLFLIIFNSSQAQPCTGTISSFPYTENFESNNGNWTVSGTSPTWAWGDPNKPVITNAAGGSGKCWVTGGLTSGSYASNEKSYLTSPCFDFTGLVHPMIAFDVFWESERKYDGAKLEYSINNGTSWVTVGDINSNNNPCIAKNWYNYNPINYINNTPGWSGNKQPTSGSCQGGGGSNTWVPARHALDFLAGQPSVRFRFMFGAGSQCNAYDGFAVDNIRVAEAPPNTADYDYTCTNVNTIQFNALNECAVSYSWNFGDAASGANNTSTEQDPEHSFSAAGVYTVSLTVQFQVGGTATETKQVTVFSANASVVQPVLCNGGDGMVNVTTNVASTYTYSWNSSPAVTTQQATLPAGTYTVTVIPANGCSATSSVTLADAAPITETHSLNHETCGNSDGSIQLTTNAVNPTFAWSNGATTQNLNNVPAGTYSLIITDGNGCVLNVPGITVNNTTPNIVVTETITPANCAGQNGSISLSVNGPAPISYLWSNGSTASSIQNVSAGNYSVTIAANGCSVTENYTVATGANNITASVAGVTNEECGNAAGAIQVTTNAVNPTFAWSNGATIQNITGLSAGSYTLTITDGNGCTHTMQSITISNNTSGLTVTETITPATCTASNGAVRLQVNAAPPVTYQWSNGSTTSALQNIAAGNYSVTVSANGCSTTKNIVVPSAQSPVTATVTNIQQETCGNGSGAIAISAAVSGTGNTAHYSWSNDATTRDISNLTAGNYSVTITDDFGCSTAISNIIVNNSPGNLQATPVIVPAGCTTGGSVSLTVTGATGAVAYLWSNGTTQAQATDLPAGTYSVVITDANNCTASINNIVVAGNSGISLQPVVKLERCQNANGYITLQVTGATGSLNILWSTGAVGDTLKNIPAGTYSVQVTDAAGCTANLSDIVIINQDVQLPVYLGNDTTICPGNSVHLYPGAFQSYTWQDGSTASSFTASQSGTYTVTVTDDDGCIGSDEIRIEVNCNDVYFPNAFTPNNDNINDLFGPAGNVGSLRNYNLVIYNRYGQKVFESVTPNHKWNGRFTGLDQNTQVFVWTATYTINGQAYTKKGTVLVIR